MTQHQIIKKHLKSSGQWTPSYELLKVNTPFGWLGSQADRRARELAERGEILRRKIGKYAEYKTKGESCYESITTTEATPEPCISEAKRQSLFTTNGLWR